jgi:PAS domain S-box-containing protein
MTAFSNKNRIQNGDYPILSFVLFIASFFFTIHSAMAEESPPEVLILSSYHQGEDWSDNQLDGIRIAFKKGFPFLVPSIEHLDTKRYPDPNHLLFVKQYLERKYQKRHIDLTMTLDNPALDLMLKFGDELFPHVPIVFAGVNGYRPEMLASHENITGVAEVQDIAGTLDLALKIHPGTKLVFAIHDYTSSGLAVHRDMEDATDRFKGKATVEYSPEATVDDLIAQLKTLPQNAIVLLLTYVTDKNGRTLSREESTRLITSASPVPVYAMHETRIGYGIAGGMLLEGREHGKQAAALALRIVRGEDIAHIPVQNSRSRAVFDYRVLARFGIPERRLPADAVIINRPVSFWQQHRVILLPGAVILIVLAISTALLSWMVVRMRRAEQALVDTNQFNKEIIDSAQEGVIVYDHDIRYRVWNPFMEKLSGVPAHHVLGHHPLEVFPFLQETQLMDHLAQALAGKTPAAIDFPFSLSAASPSGWTSDQSGPLRNAKGDIIGVIATVRNITDRKRIEQSLRENEEKYRTLFENMAQGVFYQRADGKLIDCNQAALQMFGRTRKQFLNKTSMDPSWKVIREDGSDFPGEQHPSMVALQTGKPVNAVIAGIFNPRKEDYVWVNINAIPQFKDGDDTPYQVFVTLHDITEKRRHQEALKASESKYRTMMEAMDDPTYICSREFRVEYMNAAMIKRLGHDATGEPCYQAMHGLDEKCSWCIHEKVMEGEFIKTEVVSPRDNKIFLISNSPISHVPGTRSKLTVFHDITEIKKMEEKLQQAQRMESIGTLAGGIAHDFNNILYPLLGFAELLKEDIPADSPLQEHIDEILRATMRSKDLVQQILAFSRKGEQGVKPIKLNPIIKEALKLLRSSVPATIDIKQDMDVNCGVVIADPTQIHQIMMNLATNAYHAMEDSGGTLLVSLKQVEVTSHTDSLQLSRLTPGSYALLTVSDTGTGIEKAILDRIFDPYFTTKGVGKGTGLGLSVVEGIVNTHKGDILIDSKPGKGTAVRVYLPIMEIPVEENRIEDCESLPGGTEKILLVDDEAVIARMERQMLQRLGYVVDEFTSSLRAIEAFRATPEKFDLVITDRTMPEMTGIELAGELVLIKPELPIIICTGNSDKISEEKLTSIGIKGFLMKPVVKSDIAKMVRKMLDEAKA